MRRGLVVAAALSALLLSCLRPEIMLQDGRQYTVSHWDAGLFVYVTYYWDGGKFDDAVELERDFVRWGRSQDMVVLPAGRFPSDRTWQLGFFASRAPDRSLYQDYLIDTMHVPAGRYASLQSRGRPERLFVYWDDLREWLEEDGLAVQSPVFEIYTGLLRTDQPEEQRRGELRYRVSTESDSVAAVAAGRKTVE